MFLSFLAFLDGLGFCLRLLHLLLQVGELRRRCSRRLALILRHGIGSPLVRFYRPRIDLGRMVHSVSRTEDIFMPRKSQRIDAACPIKITPHQREAMISCTQLKAAIKRRLKEASAPDQRKESHRS